MVRSNISQRSVTVRPAAVAGAFYPADRVALKRLINHQLDYGRTLLRTLAPQLPSGAPKAVIVPHAGYVYSGTTAALAYALLERGRGTVTRAVIVGPTHRVAVRGVACSTWDAFDTPLGEARVDTAAERAALGLETQRLGSPEQHDVSQDVSRNVSRSVSQKDDDGLRSGMSATVQAPAPALIVNDPTHAQEHAVEVQIPFLQTVFGPDLTIVPLNAGDASPSEVGDVLRALWGGPETVIVISSDLSHYHPHAYARELDDHTIADILALRAPINPRRACGAYPINGLIDVLTNRTDMRLFELGCATSGDNGVVALAGQPRPAMRDADEPVVGYASFAAWEDDRDDAHADDCTSEGEDARELARNDAGGRKCDESREESRAGDDGRDDGHGSDDARAHEDAHDDRGSVLLALARAAIRERLGLDDAADDGVDGVSDGTAGHDMNAKGSHNHDRRSAEGDAEGGRLAWTSRQSRPWSGRSVARILAAHPWLDESGASFVTLTEGGRLRGCIGSLVAYRPLGKDVAAHAVDAAVRDPRFNPVTAAEYPLLDVEVSVLGEPEPIMVEQPSHALADEAGASVHGDKVATRPVRSRSELEAALRPGCDGLILADHRGRSATFLPQVWDELPDPHEFVSHLLAKAGIRPDYDWTNGNIDCQRYEVTAYAER